MLTVGTLGGDATFSPTESESIRFYLFITPEYSSRGTFCTGRHYVHSVLLRTLSYSVDVNQTVTGSGAMSNPPKARRLTNGNPQYISVARYCLLLCPMRWIYGLQIHPFSVSAIRSTDTRETYLLRLSDATDLINFFGAGCRSLSTHSIYALILHDHFVHSLCALNFTTHLVHSLYMHSLCALTLRAHFLRFLDALIIRTQFCPS